MKKTPERPKPGDPIVSLAGKPECANWTVKHVYRQTDDGQFTVIEKETGLMVWVHWLESERAWVINDAHDLPKED